MNVVERREGIILEDDLVRLLESDIGEISERELTEYIMEEHEEDLPYYTDF